MRHWWSTEWHPSITMNHCIKTGFKIYINGKIQQWWKPKLGIQLCRNLLESTDTFIIQLISAWEGARGAAAKPTRPRADCSGLNKIHICCSDGFTDWQRKMQHVCITNQTEMLCKVFIWWYKTCRLRPNLRMEKQIIIHALSPQLLMEIIHSHLLITLFCEYKWLELVSGV